MNTQEFAVGQDVWAFEESQNRITKMAVVYSGPKYIKAKAPGASTTAYYKEGTNYLTRTNKEEKLFASREEIDAYIERKQLYDEVTSLIMDNSMYDFDLMQLKRARFVLQIRNQKQKEVG